LNLVEAVMMYRILREEFNDLDIYNAIVAKVDDAIFKILGLYIPTQEQYDLYEAVYTIMGLNDILRWLRGGEISINSLLAYILAVAAWTE